jgi:methylamine dehydrogenase accessory protein MauD
MVASCLNKGSTSVSDSLLIISQILLWVLVLLLAALTLALVRQVGLIHRRIPPTGARMLGIGPDLGAQAPLIDATDLSGRRVSVGTASGRKSLLVFVSNGCGTCNEIAPALRSIARSEAGQLDTILLTNSPARQARDYVERNRLSDLPLLVSPEIVKTYKVNSTPYAMLIDDEGKLLSKGIVNNIEHLASLVRAGELQVDSLESHMEASEASPSVEVAAAEH